MDPNETIESLDGRLVVVDRWNTTADGAEEYRHYWPLGMNAEDHPELVGRKVIYDIDGRYKILGAGMGQRNTVTLKDGGNTKYVYRETR